MITRGDIGRRIWIYQIIKRTTDSTDNNTYTKLFKCYRVGVKISILRNKKAIANPSRVNARFVREGYFILLFITGSASCG